MLSQCSGLLHLEHRAISCDTPRTDTPTHPQIILSNLDSLTIFYEPDYSVVPYLTLPHLRQLTVSGHIASTVGPFRALFSRSGCSLQHLSVIVDELDNPILENMLPFFQLAPTVTTLRLELRDRALHEVIGVLSSTATLPMLHTLTVDALRKVDDYEALLYVLRSRREDGSLKSFTLVLRHNRSCVEGSLALEPFRVLAESGLKIHIRLSGRGYRTPLVLLDALDSE
ncbi:hypothetical protein K438DRAFT_1847775 [Mycena galopus ATCC 62051]|nr:hypothetical protein K438DRAFT_1847775 [Mycena galopus ATCC 62051]